MLEKKNLTYVILKSNLNANLKTKLSSNLNLKLMLNLKSMLCLKKNFNTMELERELKQS